LNREPESENLGGRKMFCSKCGKQIPAKSTICAWCGAAAQNQVNNAYTQPDGNRQDFNARVNQDAQKIFQQSFTQQNKKQKKQQHPQTTNGKWYRKTGGKVLIAFASVITVVFLIGALSSGVGKGEHNSTGNGSKLSDNTIKHEENLTGNSRILSNNIVAGDIVYFGNYEQDNILGNGKEQIAWWVLTKENGKALLFSEKILDAKPYNETLDDVTWETCTLRGWLNNSFYSASFSPAEQAKIMTSTLVNEEINDDGSTDEANNTSDKLFLLSENELTNSAYGFNSSITDKNPVRTSQGTEFARSQGLFGKTDAPYLVNSNWWLRTLGGNKSWASLVSLGGDMSYSYSYDVNSIEIGVRPTLWIYL